MVASDHAELYTPFPHSILIDDGVESSEDASTSDIPSPVFESVYPSPPYVHYRLGHLHLPDAAPASLSSPSDACHPGHSIQVPETDLMRTLLQVPHAATNAHHHHLLLPPPQQAQRHVVSGLQRHPVLHLALEPPPIQPLPPRALSHVGEYAFNLPHSRQLEQQVHMVSAAPSPPRASFSMAPPPPEQKHAPPVHLSPAIKGSAGAGAGGGAGAAGGNAQPSSSRPRREASNVVVACRQYRARKIRCDSTRPQCDNCIRRGNECEYDAKPKRRGPDKRPGTRQRSCKKRAPEAEPGTGAARKKRRLGDGPTRDGDARQIAFDDRDAGVANGARRHSLPLASPGPGEEPSVLRMPPVPPLVLETASSAHTHELANKILSSVVPVACAASRHAPAS